MSKFAQSRLRFKKFGETKIFYGQCVKVEVFETKPQYKVVAHCRNAYSQKICVAAKMEFFEKFQLAMKYNFLLVMEYFLEQKSNELELCDGVRTRVPLLGCLEFHLFETNGGEPMCNSIERVGFSNNHLYAMDIPFRRPSVPYFVYVNEDLIRTYLQIPESLSPLTKFLEIFQKQDQYALRFHSSQMSSNDQNGGVIAITPGLIKRYPKIVSKTILETRSEGESSSSFERYLREFEKPDLCFEDLFTEEQMENMRKKFHEVDQNKDGVLDRNEFKNMYIDTMSQYGSDNMNEEQVELLVDGVFDSIDKDGDGTIDWDEFCLSQIKLK